jgi:transcription elongation factor SPT6
MSSKSERKRSKVDDDDGVFDENDDDDDDEDYGAEGGTKPAAAKKRKTKSFIDDAAEESGEEGGGDDDDEDEDDDDENDDYVKDGFVVDEDDDDDGAAPKKKDDLEDSDEESDDDERDDSRLHKVRKMRTTDRLDDDDLALIKEAQGIDDDDDIMPEKAIVEKAEKPRERVVAANEAELRRSLFYDSGEDDKVDDSKKKVSEQAPAPKARKAPRVEQYDEDGMDDFIEDDIGDQEIIRMSDRKGGLYDDDAQQEINEAQLHEASEIFGTDYLEFMQEEDENAELDDDEEELLGKSKYRERGVGVQYGVESDEEEIISDDDDDLFGDEDDDDDDDNAGGLTAQQKAEALRLKREKRTLAKAERRRQMQLKKSARRKAQLRRAFEPVQLVENFCTERDDEIRQKDIPERMFDWKAQFHGSPKDDSLNDVEEEQARWIAQRNPAIASELSMAGDSAEKERLVLVSIANALRYMHRDKLEPAFIKRYRKDYVVSEVVQNNLDSVMDENSEYDRMVEARDKVNVLLETITKSANADKSVGADAQQLIALQEELADAQKKLEETAKQENQVKAELAAVSGNDDDDDDELFGDDDDDEKDNEVRLSTFLLTYFIVESLNFFMIFPGKKERKITP